MRRKRALFSFAFWIGFCLSVWVLKPGLAAVQNQLSSKIPCEWKGVEKIVVVGDLHGAYESFLKILKGTGLVDDQLHWTGSKAHLVQIGDVLDRGDRAKDIFDLLIRLEKEAEAAGGRIHCLIGNHEEMNLSDTAFDREGCITPAQFVSFIGRSYRKKQERIFSRRYKQRQKSGSETTFDLTLHWQELIDEARMNPLHGGRRNYFKQLDKSYGDWILSHNVVIKINGIIFVHAGINETLSTRDIKKINNRYREELADIQRAILTLRMPAIPEYKRELFNAPNGPLWSRALVQNDESEYDDDVERILENLEADFLIIGHSPLYTLSNQTMDRYGGKVWVVDTGISDLFREMGGYLGALVIENGVFRIWKENSERLPISGPFCWRPPFVLLGSFGPIESSNR
jgi:hypothetical protein